MSHKSTVQSSDGGGSTSALVLSAEDIERLLTEETPDARIDILRKVALSHAKEKYTLRELSIAEQIFRLLIRDTEVVVRAALADSLKDNPSVPHDIITALARDVDEVSLPILEHSVVLSDADLLMLITSARHNARPLAIAKRKELSKQVSAALVGSKDAPTVSELMKNAGADISADLYQKVVSEFDNSSIVMEALATRKNLPLTIVEKVITLVSDTLADNLRVQYGISPATIAIETEKTRELVTLRMVDNQKNTRDIEKLVDQLHMFGRLTPSIILSSLCRGNLYFFETSLAKLSNVPVRNAQLLIHDKGALGFKALYTKAGLPDKFFSACTLLLKVVAEFQQKGKRGTGNELAQSLLTKSSGQNIENLSYILALIRQIN